MKHIELKLFLAPLGHFLAMSPCSQKSTSLRKSTNLSHKVQQTSALLVQMRATHNTESLPSQKIPSIDIKLLQPNTANKPNMVVSSLHLKL